MKSEATGVVREVNVVAKKGEEGAVNKPVSTLGFFCATSNFRARWRVPAIYYSPKGTK